jgi:hypothetical protein
LIVDIDLEPSLSERLEAIRQEYADEANRCWIRMPLAETASARQGRTRELREAVRRLLSLGVIEFCVPPAALPDAYWARVINYSPQRFILHVDATERDSLLYPPFSVPRFTLLDETQASSAAAASATMSASRPLHIIVLPLDTRDPTHSSRTVFQMRRSIHWHDFLESI